MAEYKLNLLENGIDSIEHGAAHFLQGELDEKNYKFAILHIFHGIELILKEKLARINPALIYANIDARITNQSNTINFSKLETRLTNVGVVFSKDWSKTLTSIQKQRNKIEHKDVRLNLRNTEFLLGSSIKFLIDFMKKELGEELDEHLGIDEYKTLVDAIEYYEESLRIALKKVEEKRPSDPKDQLDFEVLTCPLCIEETVVNEPDDEGLVTCFHCEEEFYIYACARCGNPIFAINPEDIGVNIFCENCHQDIIDED